MSENDRHEFYKVVPAGFNLVDATPAQLDLYGIPQKPDIVAEPRLFEFWERLVSPPFSAKRPTFRTIDPPARGGPLQSMLNWSGALIPAPRPKRFVFASAGWRAPKVSRPSAAALSTHSDDPRSLVWVGLDGHNGALPNACLPQVGTGHWPDHNPQHFAWWEWWCKPLPNATKRGLPDAIKIINNFPINAGDEILAGLEVLTSEDVLCFIKNQSTGEFRSFLARQPPRDDIEPIGSLSVEWVVERPTDPRSGEFYPLAAYDSVDFKYCMARAAERPLAPGHLITPADNALIIEMREAFADPYRSVNVSSAALRQDPNGSIGVTCTFHEPL